jgi:hypothetical protein
VTPPHGKRRASAWHQIRTTGKYLDRGRVLTQHLDGFVDGAGAKELEFRKGH